MGNITVIHREPENTEAEPLGMEITENTIWQLSTGSANGSRAVQAHLKAERPNKDGDNKKLAEGMKGHVCEAVADPNANYVLQEFIKQNCRPEDVQWIIEEV